MVLYKCGKGTSQINLDIMEEELMKLNLKAKAGSSKRATIVAKFNSLSKTKKVGVVVVGVLLAGAIFGGETTEQDKAVINNESSTQITPQSSPNVEQEVVKEDDKMMKAGMYKVGNEIEAGVYYVEATNGFGYVASLSDTTGSLGTIINNENIDTHTFIEVKDGDYLEVKGAKFCKSDLVDAIQPDSNGILGDGMYRVGIDLPAGEYKVMNTGGYVSYMAVLNHVRGGIGDIANNENLDGDIYVTVENGQYLQLNGASVKVK